MSEEDFTKIYHYTKKKFSSVHKDLTKIQDEIHQVHAKVDDMNDRLTVFEHVLKEHEHEIKGLKSKIA